ncbi:hypothetical protein BJ165DRAFT_1469297 [Panaeolus papilionaceus]|nr:hypothetical protein BJ165DRAFT_1469297 [Panaeolus papilionaceus]
MLLGHVYLMLTTLGCLVMQTLGLRNISFDDTEKSVITYSSTGQWVGGEGGKGLGTHTSSREWFAYALFNFTGVAVYYWAPLFGDNTIIDFSLDDGPSTSASLTDPDVPKGGWVMTKESAVRKSFLNLENKPHTLRISMDGARSTGIIIDYFEVTVDDDTPSQSPSGDVDLQTKYSSLKKSYNNIKTALAVVGALFGVFLFCTLMFWRGGIRLVGKGKKEQDTTVEAEVAKEESVSSSKDIEKGLSLQPGSDTLGQKTDSAALKSIMSDSDGTDVNTASVLDGSNRGS